MHKSQGRVRLRQGIVHLERLQSGGLRLRKSLSRGKPGIIEENGVAVRRARIGQRVSRVFLDRLLKVPDPLLDVLPGPLVPVVATLEIQGVGFGVFGIAFCQPLLLLPGQALPKLPGDVPGNLFLHGEDVRESLVVLLPPKVRILASVHQLRTDRERVPSLLIRLSVIPSLKYSALGSPPALTNGNTATESMVLAPARSQSTAAATVASAAARPVAHTSARARGLALARRPAKAGAGVEASESASSAKATSCAEWNRSSG